MVISHFLTSTLILVSTDSNRLTMTLISWEIYIYDPGFWGTRLKKVSAKKSSKVIEALRPLSLGFFLPTKTRKYLWQCLMLSRKGFSLIFNLQQWFPFHSFALFFPLTMIYLISFYFVSASSAIKNEFICSIVMYKGRKVRKSFLHAWLISDLKIYLQGFSPFCSKCIQHWKTIRSLHLLFLTVKIYFTCSYKFSVSFPFHSAHPKKECKSEWETDNGKNIIL